MQFNVINTYMSIFNRKYYHNFSCKTDHKKYVLNISDLGVVFRSDLSFGLRIDSIYIKTRIKNLGFLMKNN